MATDIEIDDSLYSRQRYVLGDNAMKRMARSSILVYGQGGLGVEIAKNITLAGVKCLTVQDPNPTSITDLGTQFFLRDKDALNKKNRAESSAGHLSQLNPYVSVKVLTTPLTPNTDLSYLTEFQCVVLTETDIDVAIRVNEFCRSQTTPIKFIFGDVYGVFCSSFCDFGHKFDIVDNNGEDPKETFISSITKSNPGVVTCLENHRHGFEDGDTILFREVQGTEKLNGKQYQIKVVTSNKFSICDTSGPDFQPYVHGGIATQVKVPTSISFKSLKEEMMSPTLTLIPDLQKPNPLTIHMLYITLKQFQQKQGRQPRRSCTKDLEELMNIATKLNKTMNSFKDVGSELQKWLKALSRSSEGVLPPLCAILGGILAQEALKSITGKFAPIHQWFHLDAMEVLSNEEQKQPKVDRYDSLRCCLGDELFTKLSSIKLFMVGCGAIGCEMLKNYALLGIGTAENGQVTITDHDLIEKSNLNRQFLFRPHHIRLLKSSTAKESILEINPAMNIESQNYKVCPQTESTVYTDQFFESQSICVNALDNVEARRYMDSRCLTNQRPLLESGTSGPKAHVQVIVPKLTEGYGNVQDPHDNDIPYCTLKSFPAHIEHCIQWARDKFESSFAQKPLRVNEFWRQNENPMEVIQKLKEGRSLDGAVQVSKVMSILPKTWTDCVQLARLKFEKYFNHRAKQLLHCFPVDTKLEDGSLFWQSPKRPPTPVQFDRSNEVHLTFVRSTGRLYAGIGGVQYTTQDLSEDVICSVISKMTVPEFRPSNKAIVTDQALTKDAATGNVSTGDDLLDSANRFEALLNGKPTQPSAVHLVPECFEKDDDSNGHIDFINSAANLRAAMYSIEPTDWFKTKKIAGRIIPAIATTTATVAGLVTLELIKVIKGCPLEDLRNCFFNLAIPTMILTEPAKAVQTSRPGLTFSDWDRWDVHGNPGFTLQQFLSYFKEKYGIAATSVVMGVKMIYIPGFPGHDKRLTQLMNKLLKPTPGQEYVDLVVMLEGEEGQEDDAGPRVRYFFHNS